MEQLFATIKSDDFIELRTAALEWLRDNTSQTWTDFNTHDPGITILEVVLYALTELGYKTNLDIRQLIGTSGNFFQPEELLFNAPVTIADYGRYLTMHPMVNSASIARLDCPENRLFLAENSKVAIPDFTGPAQDEILLKGLYRVIVELEEDPTAKLPQGNKDLNDNAIRLFDQAVSDTFSVSLDFYFPFWDELPENWRRPVSITLSSPVSIETTEKENSFFATLQFVISTATGNEEGKIGIYIITTPTAINSAPASVADLIAVIEKKLKNEGPDGVLQIFVTKMQAIAQAMDAIILHIMQARNLCEDFARIQLSRTQEIALIADIYLQAGTKPESVLADIFNSLDRLITPSVPTQNIQELTQAGIPADEFMEGPRPEKDGILYLNSDNTNLAKSIIVSDVVHAILDIPGVVALENIHLNSFIDGQAVAVNESNCLSLIDPVTYKPRFSRSKSAVQLYVGRISLKYDLQATIDLEQTFSLANQPVSSTPVKLGAPENLPLIDSDYYSLQHDFPAIYGLNGGELSSNAGAERRAQARQLKAYLLFFDQVLANGLTQASRIDALFSQDATLSVTLPTQIPDDIDDLAAITSAGYSDSVLSLENDDQFFERRNKMLNHLLSRFGHGESDFSAFQFIGAAADLPVLNRRNLDPVSLTRIRQKSLFLQNFPELSYDRFTAYTYVALSDTTPEASVWNSDNVSGLEKRLAIVLGLTTYNRRSPVKDADEDTLYLIEHILLRPAEGETDKTLLLSADISESDGTIHGYDRDPYSFRATLVLPGYHPRFRTIEARKKVEQIIALEMPAHIAWDAFWAENIEVLIAFAGSYRDWLILKATPVPMIQPDRSNYFDQLKAAQRKLVRNLNRLHSLKFLFDEVGAFFTFIDPPYAFTDLAVL